jgi:hypothetical protein
MERQDSELLTRDLADRICFRLDQFSAFFLSPAQFRRVAAWVGQIRARTYRRISPHGPPHVDLDGRDDHYWHLLVWDEERQVLAGSLRMALSRWHGGDWSGACSYLEHCYPGIDRVMREEGRPYAEIGRTFVAPPYQRTSLVLMVLFQAMASIPYACGHTDLLGLVSYNHFAHGKALNDQFLASLLRPPFHGGLVHPDPRYPYPFPSAEATSVEPPVAVEGFTQLERSLEERHQEPFRVPLLLRKYRNFGNARVIDLSLAKDFNQITEILMHCDLNSLSHRQRRLFLVRDLSPVWDADLSSR